MDDINKHPVRMPLNLPEIHEPRCHVCTSKYRHAIERMIALGTNFTEISRTFNDEIDRRSISHHAKEHLSYEQAAIRSIIEHEAKIISQDAEEGVKGALMYRTYLSTALKKAWDDLIEGNVRIDPSVAVQLIQQMDKFDREANSVAVEELTYQFQCFQEAVRKVLPRDLWPQLVETFNELVAQNEIKGLLPSGD
jgi:hypothetical protein